MGDTWRVSRTVVAVNAHPDDEALLMSGTLAKAAAAREIDDLGSVLLVHAEDHDVLTRSTPPSGRSYQSFLASRPAAAEVDAVAAGDAVDVMLLD